MSHIICPLCGKSSSLRRFNPENFEDDIYVQRVRGLGRGKGFAVVSRESLLGDGGNGGLILKIKRRILNLVSLLRRHRLISAKELEGLGLIPIERVRAVLKENRELRDKLLYIHGWTSDFVGRVKVIMDYVGEALYMCEDENVQEAADEGMAHD